MGYFRKAEEKKRLKKLAEETENSYGRGAYFSNRKNRYIRYYCYSDNHCNGKKRFFRRIGNRIVRRNNEEINCGKSWFKRTYELWWKMY